MVMVGCGRVPLLYYYQPLQGLGSLQDKYEIDRIEMSKYRAIGIIGKNTAEIFTEKTICLL